MSIYLVTVLNVYQYFLVTHKFYFLCHNMMCNRKNKFMQFPVVQITFIIGTIITVSIHRHGPFLDVCRKYNKNTSRNLSFSASLHDLSRTRQLIVTRNK
jgi:hypothetical protein